MLDLASGCYPSFLFGGPLADWLPVFHFHEVTPGYLEPYLAYLAENGYRTVTSEAVARLARDGVHPGPRSVALCFDDAWASVWTVVAPLLRRHGLQAITYISPERIADAAGTRPALGEPGFDAAPAAPAGPLFATWPELRALQASGVMDLQAHTLRHAMIPCAAEVLGFLAPGDRRHPHLYPYVLAPEGPRFLAADDWGAPLYPQRSRMSDALRYDHPSALAACLRHVREHGGAAFFQQAGWEAELRRLAGASAGRQETATERDAAIAADLAAAREQLQAQLRADTVRHMCFPWAVAGRAAEEAAQRTGYRTAFADRLFGARAVRAGDPPYRLMRLKHDYIRCLPGRGRRWFFTARRPPKGAAAA